METPSGQEINCPKCSAAMEEGFLLDQAYAQQKALEWIEGRPKKSIWTGVSVSGSVHREVTVYRCTSCGYLESYAR